MTKAITLLSGGLDSLVSTAIAAKKHRVVLALTFDYGQRAAIREIEASSRICRMWRIPHKVIKLPWLKRITTTALVNRKLKIPQKASGLSAKAVWVPNRNAVFINIAAAFAESFGVKFIITGFNREEAATFPDNGRKFVNSINRALVCGTLRKPKVVSYTLKMNKKEIVAVAVKNRLPVEACWPCYTGKKKLCGRCESCKRFFSAFEEILPKQG